jgi:lambda repressor-like predicted transcriptional regulator
MDEPQGPDQIRSRAKAEIVAAIKRDGGGIAKVARKIKTSRTHLSNALLGDRGLGRKLVARLRWAGIKADAAMLDALAPPTPPDHDKDTIHDD